LAHVLLWPVLSLFWLASASMFVEAADAFPGWAVALALAVCALLALVGVHMAYEALRQVGAPAPALGLGPEGLLDRRLASSPIPWAEIERLNIAHFHTTRVRFELSAAGEARVRPAMRLLARLGRALRTPSYSVSLMALGRVDREVAEAVQAWHAAMRPPKGSDRAGADQA
jgi:hypothetical protein